MRSKNKQLLSVAALSTLAACCIGASVMSSTVFVRAAEDHTHAFTEGNCACGAVKLEAESGVLTGTSQYPSVTETMIETTAAASGGAEIGCFAVAGNTATWTFNISEARENVRLSFAIKSFIAADMGGFKLTVNDQELAWAEGTNLEKTNSSANPYKLYHTEAFSVESGELTVKMEVVDTTKAAANFDYLILSDLTPTVKPSEPSTDPTTDPAEIRIEAESGVLTGTSQYPDYCSSMVESVAGASGGAEIGCFAMVGNTATWKFTLNEDHESAKLSFALKSYIATDDMSGFKLTVNDQELAWAEGSKLEATNSWADPYKIYETASFAAEKGELTVKMEIVDASKATANIDYLVLKFAATAPVPGTDPDTIKQEAESATLTGTSHYPGVAPDMIESNGAASGNKEIGCFDVTGNTATWKFMLKEAHDNATLFFAMRSFIATADMSGFKVTVNGETVAWADGEKLEVTNAAVDPYKLYKTAGFAAESGELTVVLEILDGSKAAANIDYIELSFTGSSASGEQEEVPDPTKDEFAVKVEAEDATIVGSSRYPDTSPDMIEQNDTASNHLEIGCFDVKGNTASWTFTFGANAENVRIYFYARSFVNSSTAGFGIYVDGQPIDWHSKAFANTATLTNPYKLYCSKPFSVEAGTRVVTLEVLDPSNNQCAVNFDYIMLAGFGDVAVSPVLPDKQPPEISDLKVEGEGVGKEYTVSYTAIDNETLPENFLTVVKVYYDYNGDGKEELTVTDGKFTPTKNGKYTVIVRVMDEAGYMAEQSITVQIGEEVTEDPGDGEWDLEIEKEMTPKEIAGVIVGGTAAVAALLTIGKVIFGRKKKAKKVKKTDEASERGDK